MSRAQAIPGPLWTLGPVILLAAALAQPSAAQDATEAAGQDELNALVERIETLRPIVEAEVQTRRIMRGMETGLATERFSVGPLTVVSRSDQVDVVRVAVGRALPFYVSTVAGGAEWVIADGDWVSQFYDGRMPANLGVWDEDVELVEVRQESGTVGMVHRVRELLGQRLVHHLPTRLRDWAGGVPLIEPGTGPGYNWESLHRIAVSSGSVAVRDCLAGEAARCWSVLGLPETETPITEWYTTDEIRLRALMTGQLRLRGGRGFRRGDGSIDKQRLDEARKLLAGCRSSDIEACLTVDRFGHRSPLPVIARTSLMWHALERGGEGAYARLVSAVEDGASIPDALSEAAGEPSESLVQSWSQVVVASRPVIQDDLAFAGFSSLLWILSFAGCSVFAAQRRSV